MGNRYPSVFIFDKNMTLINNIKNYEFFSYTHNWFRDDEWELKINKYKNGVDKFELGGFVAWKVQNTWAVGIIEKIVKPLKPAGKSSEQWTVSGRGVESALGRRKCMHGFDSGTGTDTQGASAEKNMHHYVDVQCITPLDPARVLSGLTLGDLHSPPLGQTINITARTETLSDILYAQCVQSGLSYELTWTGSGAGVTDRKTFEFNVIQGEDRSADVILSTVWGSVLGYSYSGSNLDTKTMAYCGGTGVGGTRALVLTPTIIPAGWGRIEEYIDASDCPDPQQIRDRGAQLLAEKTVTEALTLEYNTHSPAYTFGVDFFVGDIVRVDIDGIMSLNTRIISATSTFDRNGKTLTLGTGKSASDLQGLMNYQKMKIQVQGKK